MSLNYLIPFGIFVATAHPSTFKVTRRILGSWIASADGLATTSGVLLHALVFVIVVGYLMRLLNPRVSTWSHNCNKGTYGTTPSGGSCSYGNITGTGACSCASGKCKNGTCL
jgi:hypothetical protein